MKMESAPFYIRFRPKSAAQLAGDSGKQCAGLLRYVKTRDRACILIVGPSGSGKSTIARILADSVAGHDLNIHEINAGTEGSIDAIRKIEESMGLCAWCKGWRVYIIEEAHNLSKSAQEGLLHVVENYPAQTLFVFTSTEEKFTPAFMSRMVTLRLKAISERDTLDAMAQVCIRAGLSPKDLPVHELRAIAQAAGGNVRQALNDLELFLAMNAPAEAALVA